MLHNLFIGRSSDHSDSFVLFFDGIAYASLPFGPQALYTSGWFLEDFIDALLTCNTSPTVLWYFLPGWQAI